MDLGRRLLVFCDFREAADVMGCCSLRRLDSGDGQPFGKDLAVLPLVPDFALPVTHRLQRMPHLFVE